MSNAMTICVPKLSEAVMRHDPASGAIVIMLRSLKMYGLAQAVTDLMDRAIVRHWFKNMGEGCARF